MYNQELVSPTADQKMLAILKKNQMHDKLTQNLATGVSAYHKTGEFATYGVQNDLAIIEAGKKAYVVCVLAQDGDEIAQKQAMNEFGSALSSQLTT